MLLFIFFSIMARMYYNDSPSDIKGRISGTTFQHNVSGTIARLRPFARRIRKKINSVPQLNFLQRSHEWHQLSASDRKSWENFGIAHTKQNKYNELKYLSGFNWYVSCNNNLQLCGSPIIATAPAYTLPLAVPNFSVQITDNGIFLIPDTVYSLGNNALICYSTPMITSTFLKQRSKFVYTSSQLSAIPAAWNITASWKAVHNCNFPAYGTFYNFNVAIMLVHIEKSTGCATIGNLSIDQENTFIIGGIGNMIIQNNFIFS